MLLHASSRFIPIDQCLVREFTSTSTSSGEVPLLL